MISPSVADRIELEPYLAEWCVKGQMYRLFKNPDQAMVNAKANPVHPELAFARWCFAEYAGEMAALDEEETIAGLIGDHVKIEQYLIKWEVAVYGARVAENHPDSIKNEGISFGVGFAIALAILLPIWGICHCRSRRNAAKDAEFQRSVQMTEGAIVKEGNLGPTENA